VMLEKKRPVVPVQSKNGTEGTVFLKRGNNAAQQTLKNQQVKAENSSQEKFHLEQAARYEDDSKKKAEFQAEAEIQSMKAQQAQNHVANIKQWKPADAQKPAVIPQSRIVPQPTPENREQVRTQVRTQVQNEARMEQQRQPAAEEMIRSHAPQASQARPQNNARPAVQQNNARQQNNAGRAQQKDKPGNQKSK
jgi:hypothetical protein